MDYNPKVDLTSAFNYSTFGIPAKKETIVKWKAFSKLWRCYKENNPGNDLGHQANLKESHESKELAEVRLQVLVVVKANDACESKKEIIRLRE
jgi:hypothetical protein